jgi:hypothetical protein
MKYCLFLSLLHFVYFYVNGYKISKHKITTIKVRKKIKFTEEK